MSKKAKVFFIGLALIILFLEGCNYGISVPESQIYNAEAYKSSKEQSSLPSESVSSESVSSESVSSEIISEGSATEVTEPIDDSSNSELSSEPDIFATVELPNATTEPTESYSESLTEKPSENITESIANYDNIIYGIINTDTVATLDNDNSFALCEGQQVAIVQMGKEIEIVWYGDTALVNANDIDMYPKDYVPDFTKGQWAGCITR